MPKPSPCVEGLNAIQRQVYSFVMPLGFRKAGRYFSRPTSGGLTHVIGFQMGQYPIGDYVIPSLRESFYGKFTVNLGVYLPCIPLFEHGKNPPKNIKEYDCQIRERLGSLAFAEDKWWDLPGDETLPTALVSLLDQYGLPFLERFTTYHDVVHCHIQHGTHSSITNRGRSALEASLILLHLGRPADSFRLFEEVQAFAGHKPFLEYATALYERISKELTIASSQPR